MSNKITALIVDDEKNAREMLGKLLTEFGDIRIIASVDGVDSAITVILDKNPEIIFLDVQMPYKNGFELLHEIKDFDIQPTIIFITAYDEYAIEAIRHSAFDYITKPVDPVLLKKAIKRYQCEKDKIKNRENINKILNQLIPRKIGFNTRSGSIFVDPEEIIYIHAERNYTEIFLTDDKTHTVSLYVSEVYEKLPSTMFFRISRSAFINTKFIKRLDRKKRLVFLEAAGEQYQLKVGLKYIKEFERFSA